MYIIWSHPHKNLQFPELEPKCKSNTSFSYFNSMVELLHHGVFEVDLNLVELIGLQTDP